MRGECVGNVKEKVSVTVSVSKMNKGRMKMDKIKSVEDLEVYKRSHNLTLDIYRSSKKFPSEERFGLIPQIRRAASSICSNLMEGSHRLGKKEFRQFVGIAKGSVGELKYHLLLAKDLGYLPPNQFVTLRSEAETVSKMLNGLANSLLAEKDSVTGVL
jgi:four helix bundle protein